MLFLGMDLQNQTHVVFLFSYLFLSVKVVFVLYEKNLQQKKKSKSVKVPSVDISESIEALENEIKEIEQKLDEASNSGDLDRIIELGEKHASLTSKMEKTLSSWVN